jgi:cell division topological specificity factor
MNVLSELIKRLSGEKPKTASLAKERLQIIIAREHPTNQRNHFLPQMQQELLEVIKKYLPINPENIKVSMNQEGSLEVLDVNIILDAPIKEPQERKS